MKLHEIQQALEVLGVWKAIRRATGGGGSTIIQGSAGGGIWGTILGVLADQTDLQSVLDSKVDKIAGKQLSTEDYTTVEKAKLADIDDDFKRYTFLMS